MLKSEGQGFDTIRLRWRKPRWKARTFAPHRCARYTLLYSLGNGGWLKIEENEVAIFIDHPMTLSNISLAIYRSKDVLDLGVENGR